MAECKECEHNYIKIATERESVYLGNANWSYINVYVMCCSKCGKVFRIKGGYE